MTEYIDREKMYLDFKECNSKNPEWTPQRVATLIYRQPAADVEHVIRCRDCYSSQELNLDKPVSKWYPKGCVYCLKWRSKVDPDGYCSCAERRGRNE